MDSFTKMGEAMLLAEEGQRQIGRALADALGRGMTRLVDRMFRSMPDTSHPQD